MPNRDCQNSSLKSGSFTAQNPCQYKPKNSTQIRQPQQHPVGKIPQSPTTSAFSGVFAPSLTLANRPEYGT
ncbi:hypothetical protein [Helicobacter mehlei]|uniref:Uncharacterized protein n=1 Tax=Helicobacter mehlei TaxID=2316080 RepID=A0A553UKS0_9HELI|nr:hypothetical protein [Helicobacter mehlei]TSA80803.1 hypothetical protein FNE76_07080 [Helicobacter mehlei]